MAGTVSQFRMVREWLTPPHNPHPPQLEIFSSRNYMLLIGDQLFLTVEIILVWICQTPTDWQVRVSPVRSLNISLGNSKYWDALQGCYKILLHKNVRKDITMVVLMVSFYIINIFKVKLRASFCKIK